MGDYDPYGGGGGGEGGEEEGVDVFDPNRKYFTDRWFGGGDDVGDAAEEGDAGSSSPGSDFDAKAEALRAEDPSGASSKR